MSEKTPNEEKYRLALLNIAATGRAWAVSQGGNTTLALIAKMAREALDLTVEGVDQQVKAINWANGIRGKDSL